ncbi:MAG: LacI family DNA-binding transcriptional regulator [Phycisphaerae bacterium]|jgi:LacI family transcriptional regulator
MAVTLKEIAKEAGVSPSTASHAIRGIHPGKRSLSAKTIQRVREVAEKLGYRPNLLAAGLASNKTFTVGILVATLRGNFYERILEGITDVMHPQFTPLLAIHNYQPDRERKEIEVFIGKHVDGIIAAYSGDAENLDIYRELKDVHKMPLVLVDRGIEGFDSPVVRSDHYLSTYLAARELGKLGHKNIIFALAGRETESTKMLIDGYNGAVSEMGLTATADTFYKKTQSWSLTEMKTFAENILDYISSRKPQTTAILLQADWLAYEVLAVCQDRGIKVPEDLSVMGIEDCDPSSLPCISLSTVKVELNEVGKRAAELLIKIINGEQTDGQPLVIKPSVILRKTTRQL